MGNPLPYPVLAAAAIVVFLAAVAFGVYLVLKDRDAQREHERFMRQLHYKPRHRCDDSPTVRLPIPSAEVAA